MAEVDYPFQQICNTTQELIREGHEVYQKFTCAECGQRLTMDEPNLFFKIGSCDRCGHDTNIEASGCNYMIVARKSS